MSSNTFIILLLLMISILLLYIIFIQKKNHLDHAKFKKYSETSSLQLFNQLEAYHYIRDRLNLRDGLPYTRDWSASPDFLKLIAEHCLQNKPLNIVECSSGLSSLVLARCIQINQQGHLHSLENGADYATASQQHLQRYAVDNQANIIHAPLITHTLKNTDFQWYDIQQLDNESIDMLVIDGPPGFIQKHSRYPALPLLYKKLTKNCVIFMDDAARDEEKEIVEMWLNEFPDLKHEYINLIRGCSVLRRAVNYA